MNMFKILDKAAAKWTKKEIAFVIQEQNGYSYDDKAPVKHSAEKLASFCYFNTPELKAKFEKVYNEIYS